MIYIYISLKEKAIILLKRNISFHVKIIVVNSILNLIFEYIYIQMYFQLKTHLFYGTVFFMNLS